MLPRFYNYKLRSFFRPTKSRWNNFTTMGGSKRKHKGKGPEDKKRRQESADKWRSTTGGDPDRGLTPLENDEFEAYYKAQGFVSDDEWSAFVDSLKSPLPACFRLNTNYIFLEKLREELMEFAGTKIPATETSKEIDAVTTLQWCPNAYKLGTDKRTIRKLNVEKIALLHEWLKRHTENGDVTRQEAVSMVPPLALDVQPHHKCLDMCAAPGSKTSQLLEVISRSLHNPLETQGSSSSTFSKAIYETRQLLTNLPSPLSVSRHRDGCRQRCRHGQSIHVGTPVPKDQFAAAHDHVTQKYCNPKTVTT